MIKNIRSRRLEITVPSLNPELDDIILAGAPSGTMILYMLDTTDEPMIRTSVICETRILPDLWPRGERHRE